MLNAHHCVHQGLVHFDSIDAVKDADQKLFEVLWISLIQQHPAGLGPLRPCQKQGRPMFKPMEGFTAGAHAEWSKACSRCELRGVT